MVKVSASLELSWFLVELPARSGRILDHPFHRGTIFGCLARPYARDEISGCRYGSAGVLKQYESGILVIAVVLQDLDNFML
jgi:hypothetical protein